jgi:bacillithiol biosynthesis deacetylase BshB2
MQQHVLVVLAHPDDETFGCGGTIARFTRDGVPVTYVCATRGEMGRRMGKPPFATRETLRHLREQELRSACAALGVQDLRFLGLWDKLVEFADPEEVAERILAIIREVKPTLVITFHPEFGGHPDHNAVGAATIRAIRKLAPAERPEVRCLVHSLTVEQVKDQVQYVDITAVADRKEAAIRAHRSQSEGLESMLPAGRAEEWRKRMLVQERYVPYPIAD